MKSAPVLEPKKRRPGRPPGTRNRPGAQKTGPKTNGSQVIQPKLNISKKALREIERLSAETKITQTQVLIDVIDTGLTVVRSSLYAGLIAARQAIHEQNLIDRDPDQSTGETSQERRRTDRSVDSGVYDPGDERREYDSPGVLSNDEQSNPFDDGPGFAEISSTDSDDSFEDARPNSGVVVEEDEEQAAAPPAEEEDEYPPEE